MDLHEMLLEDEILLCGLVLLLGIVTGAVARGIAGWREKEDGMNLLLAHHLEAHHFPVLLGLFAAGFYVGWQLLSRWLNRPRMNADER